MKSEHVVTGLAVALLVTLAPPVPASAATARFDGPIAETDYGKITLVTEVKRGKVKKVTSFAVRRLPLECTGGETTTTSGKTPPLNLRVSAGRQFGIGADFLTFYGRFSRDYKRVRGELEIDVPLWWNADDHCGTARHRYVATR
jgi:hypothetical protein